MRRKQRKITLLGLRISPERTIRTIRTVGQIHNAGRGKLDAQGIALSETGGFCPPKGVIVGVKDPFWRSQKPPGM